MSIKFVNKEEDFNKLLKEQKYVVAQFTASWCGPCQAIKPVIDNLYASDKYVGLEVVRVDLDAAQAIASKHRITSVPTFVFYENGKEANRVLGASPLIVEEFDKFNSKAVAANVGNVRGGAAAAPQSPEVAAYIPKGYSVLNDVIHFGEALTLNVLPLVKGKEADAKYLFKSSDKNTDVLTDADSQALFFVPLNNISKVYSVLIKFTEPESHKEKELELDEEEIEEESQKPNKIKLWINKPGIMSFDDAAADEKAPHVDVIDESKIKDGWYESKVRFVRFQSVQNLNVFVDGEDKDKHTLIEKIVLVGVSGDSRDQGSLQPLEDD